jgi:hypothetical protein
MNTQTTQIKNIEKGSCEKTIDLEFEHYLFEVYLNDRIENEILRMMEYSEKKFQILPYNRLQKHLNI